jgi:hypothetical protein
MCVCVCVIFASVLCIAAVAGLVGTIDCSRKSLLAAPSAATDATVVGSQFIRKPNIPESSSRQNVLADRIAAVSSTSGEGSAR